MDERSSGADTLVGRYLAPLWERRLLIAAVVVLATVVTYVYTASRPDDYRASAMINVRTDRVEDLLSGGDTFPGERTIGTETLVLDSDAVKAAAVREARAAGVTLTGDFTVKPFPGADFVVVETTRRNPRVAAAEANAVARALVLVRRRMLRRAFDSARRAIRGAGPSPADSSALVDQAIQQLDRATPPSRPVGPRPIRTAFFAFVLAAFFACLGAYVLDWLFAGRR